MLGLRKKQRRDNDQPQQSSVLQAASSTGTAASRRRERSGALVSPAAVAADCLSWGHAIARCGMGTGTGSSIFAAAASIRNSGPSSLKSTVRSKYTKRY